MKYQYHALALVSLTFLLTGCGGGGGSQPTPSTPKGIINITTDDGQDVNNIHLTNGVVKSSQLQTSLHDSNNYNLVTSDDIVIEYAGDEPTLPTSPSGEFHFSPLKQMACYNPQSSTDMCAQTTVTYNPTKVSDDTSESFFNGKVTIHGSVPFRMVALPNQTLVIGSQVHPDLNLNLTTQFPVNGQMMAFNAAKMPKIATFTNKYLLQPASTSLVSVPFQLLKNANGTISATYTCTQNSSDVCTSDFINLHVIKPFAAKDSQLSYSSLLDNGQPSAVKEAMPVSLTLARDFVVTTNQGEVYALENPTKTKVTLLGNAGDNGKMFTFGQLTNNKSISNITINNRDPYYNDILNVVFGTLNKNMDIVSGFGEVTGDGFDMNLVNTKNIDNKAINYVTRSRYNLGDNQFVASLIPSATPSVSSYQMVIDMNNVENTPVPQVINLPGIPVLNNAKMVMTAIDSNHVSVIVSGLDKTSNQQKTFSSELTYANAAVNNATVATFTDLANTNLNNAALVFDYNTYQNHGDVPMLNSPEQKMVFINNQDTVLTLVGGSFNKTTPVITSINLASANISGTPIGFSCEDTDVSSTNITNTCYLLMNNPAQSKPYTMYQLSNVNADANSTISPTITAEANSPEPANKVQKAIALGNDVQIDGNTGATLLIEKSASAVTLELFNINQSKGSAVTLPTSPDSKQPQQATNIFEY